MTSYTSYIVVTGGTSGIGLQAAKDIAAAQPQTLVVITGRTAPAETLASNIELRKCDLGDSDAVRKFALDWNYPPVSALVLNAGLMSTGFKPDAAGLEPTFAVNHTGHALLFFSMLSGGHLSPTCRIIATSSSLHRDDQRTSRPHWTTADDVAHGRQKEQQVGGTIYSNTKLANVFFIYGLESRAQASGRKWSTIIYDPGFVPGGGSQLGRQYGPIISGIFNVVGPWLTPAFELMGVKTSTVPRSGKMLADLATEPQYADEHGAYYHVEAKTDTSECGHDVALQDDLWDWTVKELGVGSDPKAKV